MKTATGHILRSNDVESGGRYRLTMTQPGPVLQNEQGTARPQVRIVENGPDFSVLEIICGCGRRTYLQCEYANDRQVIENSLIQETAAGAAKQVPESGEIYP